MDKGYEPGGSDATRKGYTNLTQQSLILKSLVNFLPSLNISEPTAQSEQASNPTSCTVSWLCNYTVVL